MCLLVLILCAIGAHAMCLRQPMHLQKQALWHLCCVLVGADAAYSWYSCCVLVAPMFVFHTMFGIDAVYLLVPMLCVVGTPVVNMWLAVI